MIDTHCHLDFPNFKNDLPAVLARATEAGVMKILNPGTSIANSRAAIRLSETHENVFAAVGIHPHEASSLNDEVLEELESLASHEKVVAVGEIGLDFFRMRNTKEVQIEAFRKLLALAVKIQKPIIIHAREADRDILTTLDEFPNLRGVFHCFGGDADFAEKVLARGFLIGFTGVITFPKAEVVREVVRRIPLEKILIETDAPFLAPQKFRGQRCEPSYVLEVAQAIAKLKEVSVEEIAKQTTQNAEELFGI